MARNLPIALLAAVALAAAAAGAAERFAPPRVAVVGSVWRFREGDLLYRFHATFREERLFDAAADPFETKDLAPERPEDLARLRAAFLRRLRVPTLEKVPKSGEAWREIVEGLGYR